ARVVQRPAIVQETRPGMDVTRILFQAHQELHLSLRPIPGEKPLGMASRLASVLKAHDARVVRHEVFGSRAVYAETMQALQREIGEFDWPVTWVGGEIHSETGIYGMHVFAVAGTPRETVWQDGQPVGRIFSDGCFKHCILGGITSSKPNALKSDQCRELLERLAAILGEAGMDMTNVVRTWFFLDDIFGWYGDFNRARNEFFSRTKVFSGLVPASTGIGGQNPLGSALVAGVWAVRAETESATVREVVSPLQCPATNYGSAFSRAILMEAEGWGRLLVSGTASIGPGGETVHGGDLMKQIETSMAVTQAILKSCGFDYADVTRAIAYFKNAQEDSTLASGKEWLEEKCPHTIVAQADICRPDLLFEIELDAIL
ncbi:MAG: RidA family protein, partial [Verrucomicrobiota bacterium]